MKNAGSVVLISSLFAGCNPEEKAKLSELYKSAFVETAEYKELFSLINDSVFEKGNDNNLFKNGKEAISDGMTKAEEFIHVLTRMKFFSTQISKELEKTSQYLASANMNNETLSVMKKTDEEAVREFYIKLLKSFCFMGASLYGPSCLDGVEINLNSSVFDIIKSVSTACTDICKEVDSMKPPMRWVIYRENFAWKNMIHYGGFGLSYQNLDIESYQTSNGRSPFLFVPTDPKNEVLCFGVGNIVVTKDDNELSLIDSEITTQLPIDVFDGLNVDYNNFDPLAVLRAKYPAGAVVITPQDFVDRLNRYFMIETVKTRKKADRCIYCGSATCDKKHFKLSREFGTLQSNEA